MKRREVRLVDNLRNVLNDPGVGWGDFRPFVLSDGDGTDRKDGLIHRQRDGPRPVLLDRLPDLPNQPFEIGAELEPSLVRARIVEGLKKESELFELVAVGLDEGEEGGRRAGDEGTEIWEGPSG